jgi:hypothetical protein
LESFSIARIGPAIEISIVIEQIYMLTYTGVLGSGKELRRYESSCACTVGCADFGITTGILRRLVLEDVKVWGKILKIVLIK